MEIVFDYGVPANECQPQVAAFNVEVNGSNQRGPKYHDSVSIPGIAEIRRF